MRYIYTLLCHPHCHLIDFSRWTDRDVPKEGLPWLLGCLDACPVIPQFGRSVSPVDEGLARPREALGSFPQMRATTRPGSQASRGHFKLKLGISLHFEQPPVLIGC